MNDRGENGAMEEKPVNLIYLLGAGRSGTTMLATILNNHPNIHTVGEMHQFLDYLLEDKDCSCGENLSLCNFWAPVLNDIDLSLLKNKANVALSNSLEKHHNIPLLLLGKPLNTTYSAMTDMVFKAIHTKVSKPWLLDSSKYISRYLLLRKNKNINLKGIYLVRDVRGVVYSFGKNVQTPKNPLSAIFYYSLVNIWAQLVSLLDRKVIKIRYEDFVNEPELTIQKIEKHLFGKTENISDLNDKTFDIPHIIAGNRLRSQKQLVIKKDVKWKEGISRSKQILYYIAAFPLMAINKYKP
ncbi:sulfotransferase [Aequorivita sp. Q41]|uniref:sulfotransferase family protein n=1 Tax=Aequorivita sp. Q41 TaxID=3153300 RepID=UPI003242A923